MTEPATDEDIALCEQRAACIEPPGGLLRRSDSIGCGPSGATCFMHSPAKKNYGDYPYRDLKARKSRHVPSGPGHGFLGLNIPYATGIFFVHPSDIPLALCLLFSGAFGWFLGLAVYRDRWRRWGLLGGIISLGLGTYFGLVWLLTVAR